MKVSVVATVLNEQPAIGRLLESLAAQTRPPDEVVIVDGGSTDGTLELLKEWLRTDTFPLLVLERPGANISQGRNAAIDAASGDVVATTDAGVRIESGWLEAEVILPQGQWQPASGMVGIAKVEFRRATVAQALLRALRQTIRIDLWL